MTTVCAPYFDNRGGRVVDRQSTTPWTVRVRTGNEVRFYRFAHQDQAEEFYKSHALVEGVTFRDCEGKLRRWKHALVVQTRDGKHLLVTRARANGEIYKGKNAPRQYMVVPEAIVQNKSAA